MALFVFEEMHWNHLKAHLSGIATQQRVNHQELMGRIAKMERMIMSQADDVKALVGKVTAENTVIGGAVTMLNGLSAQVKALAAAGTPVDPADIKALSDAIDSGTAALSAGIAANTPQADNPAPAPVDPNAPPAS